MSGQVARELTTVGRAARIALRTLTSVTGPVVAIMAAVGSIAAIQGIGVLRHFGAEDLLPMMLAQTLVRDLAPAMTALMLAAQVGTSIAGELGAMKVGDEIDALGVIGVDPVRFLVLPRIGALAILAGLLTSVGTAAAVLAAYGVGVYDYGLARSFLPSLWAQITPQAFGEGILKASIFGGLVGALACRNGLAVEGGAEEVGIAVNRTVVQSILAIAALNAILTAVLLRWGP